MSVIRRAAAVSDGPFIDIVDLTGLSEPPQPAHIRDAPLVAAVLARVPPRSIAGSKPGSPEERLTLLTTLERTGENITSTADVPGVSRVTLYRMLSRHGIVLKRGLAEPPIVRRVQNERG